MFRCYVFVVVPWVSDKPNAGVLSCYINFPTVWCYIINHSSKVGILHTLEPCHPKVLGFSRFALGRARSLRRLCTVVEENVTGLWWKMLRCWTYCWWKKSGDHQFQVGNLSHYLRGTFTFWGGCLGFLNHQQYAMQHIWYDGSWYVHFSLHGIAWIHFQVAWFSPLQPPMGRWFNLAQCGVI